jgi:hypothetical protein
MRTPTPTLEELDGLKTRLEASLDSLDAARSRYHVALLRRALADGPLTRLQCEQAVPIATQFVWRSIRNLQACGELEPLDDPCDMSSSTIITLKEI